MIKFQPYILQVVLCVFSEDVLCSRCEEGCCRHFYKDYFNGSCVEGNGSNWKYVAFTLIGSIITIVAVALVILMKSWFAKRRKEDTIGSNESQSGGTSLIHNDSGNRMEESKYEGQINSSSPEEIEAVHLYNICAENNYADLRQSVLSPIYDDPGDFETNLKPAFVSAINTLAASK